MIRQLLESLHRWLAPPSRRFDPSRPFGPVQHYADAIERAKLPPSDGRVFVWIRARGATYTPLQAQIVFDKSIGPPRDIVAERVLLPSEYGDDLNTLIARYPAPTVIVGSDA